MRFAAVLLILMAFALAGAAQDKSPWRVPADAAARKNPIGSTPQSVERGRTLYHDYCLVCHGERGAGDGPWITRLPTPPGDLTERAADRMSDGELFWKISRGRGLMPGYGSQLSASDRWHLVNYLRTLVRGEGKPPATKADGKP